MEWAVTTLSTTGQWGPTGDHFGFKLQSYALFLRFLIQRSIGQTVSIMKEMALFTGRLSTSADTIRHHGAETNY